MVYPAPAPPRVPLSVDYVQGVAREYVAAHPEIANEPSYDKLSAVAPLREGVIAALISRGYRAGRILGPDGAPYPQTIAFGNPDDPDARAYRVTAGGARISEAITVGCCDENVPGTEVH